jgi:hypothetical protein
MLCSSAPGLAAEDDGTGGCGCAADWTGASAIDGVSPGCMHLAATGFRLPSTRPWDCDPGIPASLQTRGWFCFALAARDPTTQLLLCPACCWCWATPNEGDAASACTARRLPARLRRRGDPDDRDSDRRSPPRLLSGRRVKPSMAPN